MEAKGYTLAINPGSTSTKLAIFKLDSNSGQAELVVDRTLDHTSEDLGDMQTVMEQLDLRTAAVRQFMSEYTLPLDLIMARSAPLRPMEGGSYLVEEAMLEDIRSARYADHASNLAALIATEIAAPQNIPVYITDPITTDEMLDIARISGVPGIQRRSRCHALNMKACLRRVCDQERIALDNSNWVVCHMGGGISVAAIQDGRLIDVNDALLGMGPFSPERAGALPLAGLLDLVFEGIPDRTSLEKRLARESGMKGYLGTADLRMVEQRIANGDEQAREVYQAMVLQIAKEIGAMGAVLEFEIEGIILTGGMAHSPELCAAIIRRVNRLAPVHIEAGEHELRALGEAGARIFAGLEAVKHYLREAE